MVAYSTSIQNISNWYFLSGTTIKADSVTTLNFVGAGNTFKVNGNTVDVSIEGGGAVGVSSNSFTTLVGSGFTHFNFIGAGITALGTGDVGGAKTAVVTINKTLTIGKEVVVLQLSTYLLAFLLSLFAVVVLEQSPSNHK